MKKIMWTLLVFLCFFSCEKPRNIKDMLHEKGYKCSSILKVDTFYNYMETFPRQKRIWEIEMEVDSIIKTTPFNVIEKDERKVYDELAPRIAARFALRREDEEKVGFKILDEYKNKKQTGWLAKVRMNAFGGNDIYYVVVDKNSTKIRYIYPANYTNDDFREIFIHGILGTHTYPTLPLPSTFYY